MTGFLGSSNFTFISNSTPQLPSGIITGSVSSPYVPYANGANTLANSGLSWDAVNSRVGVNNASPTQALDVTGSIKTSANIYSSLTQGSVPFIGASGLITQDNANFFWDATNARLGIGTITPTYKVDIHGAGTVLGLNGTGTNNSYLIFQNAGAAKWRVGNTYSSTANYFSIYDNVNSLDRLTILNSGFVGIGTSSPSVLLHINSAATPAFRLVDTTQGAGYVLMSDANGNGSWSSLSGLNIPTGTGTDTYVTFWTGTNTLSKDSSFVWDYNNKRLGIGTANPSVALHINSAATPAFRLVDTTQGAGKYLTSDANGNASWGTITIPSVSGTSGYVARFTAATGLGNGIIQDNGVQIGIAAAPNASYTVDLAGTMRMQQSVTMVASGAYYVGIGIAPSSNGRLNVYANSITGIYITGNSLSQKGIDMNGTILALATAAGVSSTIQASGGSGNLSLTGLGGIVLTPDAITSSTTNSTIGIVANGAGGYQTTLTNVGTVSVNGSIYCGASPYASGTGSGWIFTVDPATGAQNTNGWALGNKTTGAVTLDTAHYVRIDIGGTLIKFLIST